MGGRFWRNLRNYRTNAQNTSNVDTAHTRATSDDGNDVEKTRQNFGSRSIHILKQALLHTSLPEIMLLATLCFAKYMLNADFSYPSEVILDIVLLGLLSTVIFYIYKLLLRRALPAHIAALPVAYGLYSFSYSFAPLHHFADRFALYGSTPLVHTLLQLVVLVVAFGLVGYGADTALRHIKPLRALQPQILKFLVFVVCFIFAAEMGKVGLRVWSIRHDLLYKAPSVSLQKKQNSPVATTKPNVYYLLLDRYASSETLANTYKYDNSPFINTLGTLGFVDRPNAYANYPFTMQSVSSTLSMDYHSALGKQFRSDAVGYQSGFPYREILDNTPVVQTFKANGYSYNHLSSWWDFTRNVPSADTEPTASFRLRIAGKNFWLTDLQRDIVNKSILSPLLLKGMIVGHIDIIKYSLDRNPAQNFSTQLQALTKIADASTTTKQPQFTFAHFLSPHDPYVFDSNGNPPLYDGNRDDSGIDETQKYINQLTYVNTQYEKVIRTIRTKDPGAIVIIQADEGPYPKQFRGVMTATSYYDPVNLPVAQMRQKFGILANYYMPGVDPAVVNAKIDSSVNVFRFVFDTYLGYNLPPLPDCNFSVGSKFSLYNYQLVTGKLKDTSNPLECSKYK